VVHEVGHAGDAAGRHVELVDRGRIALGRRRDRRRLAVVLVEGEPDGDASPGRVLERPGDEPLGLVREAEVVDRDVERALRGGDEVGERAPDLERRLAAVGECPDLDQPDCCAFIRALYARFSSW
jgi:hypothetical protein